jgi:stress response protein YsnF
MFKDASEARLSFDDLTRLGIDPNDVSIVQIGTRPTSGLGLSAIKSADDGSMMSARGPVAARLGKVRGLTTTLANAGVSSGLVEHYMKALRQGETLELVTVEDNAASSVVDIMKRHAARYDESTPIASAAATESAASPTATTPGATSDSGRIEKLDGERVIPLIREELRIAKRDVNRGVAHVGLHVAERPVSEKIRLREEFIELDRRPVNRAPQPGELEFRKTDFDVELRGEDAVIAKQVRVVEEIHLRKKIVERDETITDTLRSTELDLDEPQPQDLSAYASHYGTLGGGNFEEARPAYDYGRQLNSSGTERWEDVEPRARAAWETRHPGTWEKFRESVRYAYGRARGENKR